MAHPSTRENTLAWEVDSVGYPNRDRIKRLHRRHPLLAQRAVDRARRRDEQAMRADLATVDRLGLDEDSNPTPRYADLEASREEAEQRLHERREQAEQALRDCWFTYGLTDRHRTRAEARCKREFRHGAYWTARVAVRSAPRVRTLGDCLPLPRRPRARGCGRPAGRSRTGRSSRGSPSRSSGTSDDGGEPHQVIRGRALA